MKIKKEALCIRKRANFSIQNKNHKIDKPNFNLKDFQKNLEIISPKVIKLLETIKNLDEADMKNHKKHFKHVIYTDIKDSAAGSKMIAASLLTKGYTNVYDSKLKLNEDKLSNNNYKNFALLCSVQIYNKPFPVKLKKSILTKYNERPDNINGKDIRFIILDSGYKEGIDLFDVKYLHIFEPLITKSDEKQVIGRGTRFCGQKGLVFQPNIGWPLHIFKYNLNINEDENAHELFMTHSDIDISKLQLSSELENISKYGAVDYNLNENIHNIGNENNKNIKDPLLINGGGIKGKKTKGLNINLEKSPNKILKFIEMREYIKDRFIKYKWDKIVFKNNCIDNNIPVTVKKIKYKSLGGKLQNISDKEIKSEPLPAKNAPPSLPPKDERLITLTPTQDFVSKYFNNSSAYKGLLLWHSVGTGKTCSAIATATKGFEEHDYTILWVTRHTLKSDIWKNMFSQVCSSIIRRKIIQGENIPKNIKKNYLKYLSKSWIMPISYKQFSNMLSEKNQIYKLMTKINGKNDPLRKTLVIIDEAHKLYSPDTLPAERPNLEIMNKKIKSSYKLSGKESVKLLLMTATPYTNNPMDLIKLINLMKEDNLIPEDFDEFSAKYLKEGKFSEEGSNKYLNDISGYISYLNRENDARNFAFPVFYNIDVNASKSGKDIDDVRKRIESLEKDILDTTNVLEFNKEPIKNKKMSNSYKITMKKDKIDNTKKLKDYKTELKKYKKILKESIENDISQETLINKCIN